MTEKGSFLVVDLDFKQCLPSPVVGKEVGNRNNGWTGTIRR